MAQSQNPPPQSPADIQSDSVTKSQGNPAEDTKSGAQQPTSGGEALTNDEKKSAERDTRHGGDEASEFWSILGRHVKITDTLLVVFTFFLFIATGCLWWTTRDLVNGAEETAERQLRAYVTIITGQMQITNLLEGGKGISVNIELKNSGQTPGYDFTTWIRPPVILENNAVPFGAPLPIEERTGTSIIGPGGSAHLQWHFPVSDTDLAAIQSGAKSVFVWGGADYSDIFKHQRYFIFRSTNGAGIFTSVGNIVAVKPHKRGYEAN